MDYNSVDSIPVLHLFKRECRILKKTVYNVLIRLNTVYY